MEIGKLEINNFVNQRQFEIYIKQTGLKILITKTGIRILAHQPNPWFSTEEQFKELHLLINTAWKEYQTLRNDD